ncbi:MAG: hypothetical protein LBU32_09700 [Clostridiales bacterium]|nr:hypothetical protein [Clostridiales bacterium]
MERPLEDAGHGGDLKNILGGRLPMLFEKLGEIEDPRKHPSHNIKTVLPRRNIMPVLCLSSKGNGWPPLLRRKRFS